jgi:YYY domain-containing protein
MPESVRTWWDAVPRRGPAVSLILLALILAVGFGLRLHGINWDAGYGFHPDERSIYLRAGCMYDVLTESPAFRACIRDFPQTEPGFPSPGVLFDAGRSPLNPHWFPLGSILIYILVMLRSILELFLDIGDLDMRYAGRLLSALADVGTVYMVYWLGKRMFSRNAGLLAAVLTALAVVHVQSSHFYRPETFSVFLTLVCFWAMLRMVEYRRLRDSLLLGALVGLAMAPKVSVLPLVLPLALAYSYSALKSTEGRWSGMTPEIVGRVLFHAGLAGLSAVAVFFLLAPYALLDFAAFIGELAAQANMARHAGLWPFTIQYVNTPAYWYQIQQTTVWGLGIPLGLVAWFSIPFTAVMALKERATRYADLLLLAWVVPQIIFLESFEVRFLRYYFPLMPFMILMGARLLFWLVDCSRSASLSRIPAGRRIIRELPKFAVALVVVSTAFYSMAFQNVYAREHPAVAASKWIQQNLPAGSRIVSDNHWDEFIPDLYHYDLWQFPAYDPDTAEKMSALASKLSEADYLVFYSYRPYVSVSRDPDRFPFTSGYYQQLFQGGLGFRLERSFTSYPEFLGVSFRDSPYARAGVPEPVPSVPVDSSGVTLRLGYADDNVVGYDHPQVLLFRNVDRLPESVLQGQLSGGRGGQQLGDGLGLMLSAANQAKQRSGGTWSELFQRGSWSNRYPVLAWLLAIEMIYLLALPLSIFVFRPLPDRGIVLARVLGLLAVGYVSWLMVSLGWIEFSRVAILLGLLVIALLSAAVTFKHWPEIKSCFAENWRLLLIGEGLFLIVFLAFVLVRAANPDLWHPFRGGEKPMELAYLNAVVRSTTLPPYDPWYAGGYLNYYYWGYYILALPIRLTGIIPTTAFNLAVPLFFALTFTGAYSIAYNLVEGVRRSRGSADGRAPRAGVVRALMGPVGAGLASGLFVAVIGNLDGAVQIARGLWRLYQGASGFPAFDFWRSSRMIPPLEEVDPSALAFWAPDKVAGFTDVSYHITEFPFFTFLFADLHAHMMVIPFTLLVIGLGLNLVVGLKDGSRWWTVAASSVLGLALGALWVINSWDYPPYLVLVLAMLVLAVYTTHRSRFRKAALLLFLMVGVTAVSVLAFLPFREVYETFDAGAAGSRWRTPIERYIAIHGLVLFVAVTFLIHQSGRSLVASLRALISGIVPAAGRKLPDGFPRYDQFRKGLCLCPGLLVMIYLLAAGYWTAAALTGLLFLTGMALWDVLACSGPDRPYRAVPLLLLGMALAIGIGVDFVRLNGDIGRMNTLFKLYLEAWVLFGIAASFMLWYLGGLRRRWGGGKAIWAAGLLVLFTSSLIYTGLGTRARIADRFSGGPFTLDGTAYLNTAVHVEEGQLLHLRSDLEGIRWLEDNVRGSPVVLEAHHEQYHWSARISSYTGLPTVIGWPWHQIQQRNAYAGTISQRARDVAEMYNSTDLERTRQLLKLYQVEYVVVGELERAYYTAEGIKKFELLVQKGLALLAFDGEGMNIYRII